MKWIFENRVYSSLEELVGKTMHENNKPEPVFNSEELEICWWESRKTFSNEIGEPRGEYARKPYNDFDDYFNNEFNIIEKVDVGEGAESESEL